MDWSIELIDEVKVEIRAFPTDLRASFAQIADMLTSDGPFQIGMPYVRPLEKKLWEMRLRGGMVSPGRSISRPRKGGLSSSEPSSRKPRRHREKKSRSRCGG